MEETEDPFKEFGGSATPTKTVVQDDKDPFAAFGGKTLKKKEPSVSSRGTGSTSETSSFQYSNPNDLLKSEDNSFSIQPKELKQKPTKRDIASVNFDTLNIPDYNDPKRQRELLNASPTEVAKTESAKKKALDDVSAGIIKKQEDSWKAQHGDGYLSGVGLGIKYAKSKLATGASNIVPALVYASDRINKMLTGQPLLDDQDKSDLLEFTSKASSMGLNKEYQGSSKAMGAIGGLLEFVPAALAAEGTGGASFYLNGVGNAYKEVQEAKKNGAKFDNGSEDLYIQGKGISDYLLMSRLNAHSLFPTLPAELRNVASREASLEAIKGLVKSGEPLTSEGLVSAFKDSAIKMADNIKTKGVPFLKQLGKGYAKTSADLSALTTVDALLKKGSNALAGEENFKVEDGSVGDNIAHILTSDAPLFAALGARQNVGALFDKSPYRNEVVEALKKDASPENIDKLKQVVAQQGQERQWSPEDVDGTVNHIDKIADAVKRIPKTMSDAKYNSALDIVLGKQNLEEQLAKVKEGNKSLDPALAEIGTPEERALTTKLEQSDDKLREIATGKKVKYTQDPETGEYLKQLGGDGKPEKISKERYELEQVEQEGHDLKKDRMTQEEIQGIVDHATQVEREHRQLAENETDPQEKADLIAIADRAKEVSENAKGVLNNRIQVDDLEEKINNLTKDPKSTTDENLKQLNAGVDQAALAVSEHVLSRSKENEKKQPLPTQENVAPENLPEKGNEEVGKTIKDKTDAQLNTELAVLRDENGYSNAALHRGASEEFQNIEKELNRRERESIVNASTPEEGIKTLDKLSEQDRKAITPRDIKQTKEVFEKYSDVESLSDIEVTDDFNDALLNMGKAITSANTPHSIEVKLNLAAKELLKRGLTEDQLVDMAKKEFKSRNYNDQEAAGKVSKILDPVLGKKEVAEESVTEAKPDHKTNETKENLEDNKPIPPIDAPQGISKDETRKQREYRGEEDLQPREKQTLQGMFDAGKKAVDDGMIDPRILAADIVKKPRNLSPEEVNALLYDRQRIKNNIESLYAQIDEAILGGRKDQMEPLLQKQLYFEEQRIMNEEAVRTGANQNALAQVSMRSMITKDYSRSDQEARMQAKNGGLLTKEMRAEIKKYADQLEEANRKLKEYEDAMVNDLAKKELTKAQRENRKSSKAVDKEVLKNERKVIVDDFLAKLKEIRGTASASVPYARELAAAAPFMKKMLVNLTKEGVLELKDMVERIHEEFKAHIEDLTQDDVKDVLAGKHDENPTVKSLKNRLGRITERIANNDFAKPVPRPKVELTDEIITLRAKVKKAQNNFDAMAERLDRKNQGAFDKIADGYSAINRMFLLSGVKTLGKLYSFAAQRAISTPIEELFNTLNSKLPGLRKIAERSPRFAQGVSIRAEAKAIAQKVSMSSWKDTWQVLKDGASELDVLYGKSGVDKDFQLNPSALEFFGRLHGAFKNSTKRAEFYRSYEKRLEYAAREGKDINDPNVQFATGLEAYADGKRAILMHDNKLTDGYKNMLRAMESRTNGEKGYTGKAMATFFRTILPIVKIPTNYVLEASDFATFGVRALPKIILAAAKGSEALSPKQATMVMRTLARGQFGLGMMMIAYYNPQMFGGYYAGKRKEGDLKAGDVILMGMHLPHFMTHHPVFEAMQIAATFRRAIDSANGNGDSKGIMESLTAKNRDAIAELAKAKIDPKLKEAQSAEVEYNGTNYEVYIKNGEPTKIVKGGAEWTGFKTAVSGLSQQVPFFGTPGQISEGLKSDNKLNKFEGDFLRNRLEPRLVQEMADWSDKDTDVKFTQHPIEYMNSDVTKRDPKTIIEYLKIGIPGFRQQVGEKAGGDAKLLKITVGTDVYELNKQQGEERQKYIAEFAQEFGADITKSMKEAGKTDKDIALYINQKALDYSKSMMIEKYQNPDNDKINLKMKNQ